MKVALQPITSCCAGLYELPVVEYLLGRSFHPGGAKLTRQLASSALVSPESQVLDVACGIGNSARIIATDFGATVTGLDYSAINLERASAACRIAGLEHRTRFVRGNAESLPFIPRSFDVIVCECSLCLFESISSSLRQLHAALKPGGRIAISDFFLNAPVPGSLNSLLGQVLCVANAPSIDGYREALSRAGFEFIRIREVNWTLTHMIERVRHRIKLLATTSRLANASLPVEFGEPGEVLADLEKFIASGGAGYLLATARRTQTSAGIRS